MQLNMVILKSSSGHAKTGVHGTIGHAHLYREARASRASRLGYCSWMSYAKSLIIVSSFAYMIIIYILLRILTGLHRVCEIS